MSANLTIQDLFKLILFLLGIGVLSYLIIILNKLNKLLGKFKLLAESNYKELDTTIKQLPEISENINEITKEAKTTLTELQPEINELISNVNSISGKVGSITNVIDDTTHKVGETVVEVSDSITETANAFKFNAKNINDYLIIIKEVFDMIRSAIHSIWEPV